MLLDQARSELRTELADGSLATCVCCGQTAKIYARPLNATMVASLRAIAMSSYGLDNAQIIAATKQSGGGNVSLLQHWKLVESWPGKIWRITHNGRAFLGGHIRVPAKVILYNNIFLGFDATTTVSVVDLAGKAFDLTELLNQ